MVKIQEESFESLSLKLRICSMLVSSEQRCEYWANMATALFVVAQHNGLNKDTQIAIDDIIEDMGIEYENGKGGAA